MRIVQTGFWILSMLPVWAAAQGMIFFEGSWSQVLEKARTENKNVFVDAYTDWCGPCKMMVKNVFPLPEVGTFYNKNYINYKLNMEKGEGTDFAKTFQVGVYPSYLFFNSDGRLLHRTVGYKQGPQFIADGAAALDTTRQLITNIMKYQTGNRDPKVLYNLALGLAEAGAPDQNIEDAYLQTQAGDKIFTQENYNFLTRSQSGYRGKSFRILMNHKEKYYALSGKETVNSYLSSTLFRTLQYASGNNMSMLADSVLQDIQSFSSPEREEYMAYAEVVRLSPSPEREKYFTALIHFVQNYAMKDTEKLNAYGMEMVNTRQEDKVRKGLEWLNISLKIQPSVKTYEILAYSYLSANMKDEAKSISLKGIELATQTQTDDSSLREYLRQAEN